MGSIQFQKELARGNATKGPSLKESLKAASEQAKELQRKKVS